MHSVVKQFYGKKGGEEEEDCYRGCKTKFPEFTQALVKLHSIFDLQFPHYEIVIAQCRADRCSRD